MYGTVQPLLTFHYLWGPNIYYINPLNILRFHIPSWADFMDEVPLVPLTLNNIEALTYSLPSNSLQPGQETTDQIASDIDWVSFLSASPFIFGNQNPSSTSESLTAENGGRGENRTRNKGKASRTKKVNPSRIAFHTRSIDDILDDGYRWRKYGQKAVKNSNHPRY